MRNRIPANSTWQDLRLFVVAWWKNAAKLKKRGPQIIISFGFGKEINKHTWQLTEAGLLPCQGHWGSSRPFPSILGPGCSSLRRYILVSRWFHTWDTLPPIHHRVWGGVSESKRNDVYNVSNLHDCLFGAFLQLTLWTFSSTLHCNYCYPLQQRKKGPWHDQASL